MAFRSSASQRLSSPILHSYIIINHAILYIIPNDQKQMQKDKKSFSQSTKTKSIHYNVGIIIC
jgi:hypothetical protein